MNFFKNNTGIIIGFIVGVILASSITVYAYSYISSDISYTKPGTETEISVEEALNELYSKSKLEEPDKTINSHDGYTITENYSLCILYVGRSRDNNAISYNGKTITPLATYNYYSTR